MNDSIRRVSRERFLEVALEHGLIQTDDAKNITLNCNDENVTDYVVRSGVMDSIKADAIATLCFPTELAPSYRVDKLLGYGGMGVVYQAKQVKLDRDVALKTINLSRIQNENSVKRIEQEAKVTARFRHPNIVAAFDSGVYQGRFYIAMELVIGEDLHTRLSHQGRFAPAIAWGIVRQVASALAHAEDEGIIHRDIKPGNLLLTPPPRGMQLPPGVPLVKVTDFGLALRSYDDSNARITTDGSALGTPIYASPEQLKGTKADCRADIYALGVTFFEMVTGHSPFEKKSTLDIIVTKTSGEQSWREQFSSECTETTRQLFLDMTHFDLGKRIGSYEVLLQRIDDIMDPLSSVASPRLTVVAGDSLPDIARTMATDLPSENAMPAVDRSTPNDADSRVNTEPHLTGRMMQDVHQNESPSGRRQTRATPEPSQTIESFPKDELRREVAGKPATKMVAIAATLGVLLILSAGYIASDRFRNPKDDQDDSSDSEIAEPNIDFDIGVGVVDEFTLEESVQVEFLFQGQSVPIGGKVGNPVGNWSIATGEDGAPVLAANGAYWPIDIEKLFLEESDPDLDNGPMYALEFRIHPVDQAMAEIQFGFDQATRSNARVTIKIANDESSLLVNDQQGNLLESIADLSTLDLATSANGKLATQRIRLVRQTNGWLIQINGQRFVSVGNHPDFSPHLYRLASRNGVVHMSDVKVRRLTRSDN